MYIYQYISTLFMWTLNTLVGIIYVTHTNIASHYAMCSTYVPISSQYTNMYQWLNEDDYHTELSEVAAQWVFYNFVHNPHLSQVR